jgi:4-hydroxy-tetrahydrodipicolinate reductase
VGCRRSHGRLAARASARPDIEVVEIPSYKVDAPRPLALGGGGGGRRARARHRAARPAGHPSAAGRSARDTRGGDVVGEHAVVFAGTGERVELAHKATSRQNFATGALRAARYVAARRAAGEVGFADMRAVLGLD